jgi:hypothetical protein
LQSHQLHLPQPIARRPPSHMRHPRISPRIKAALRSPVVIDLRNIYKPADLAAKGLTYVSVKDQQMKGAITA